MNYAKIDRNSRLKGCIHFRWQEAIPANRPFPTDERVLQNILALGRYLDSVRNYLGGQPIYVTSWYRDRATNIRVGGSRNSQHLFGNAVDFYCNHMYPAKVYYLLDSWHGSKGGLGLYKTHVHLDLRGHRARWDYR